MNIVIVGFDVALNNALAMDLAKAINYKFINGENEIRKMLIQSKDAPLIRVHEDVEQKETEILTDLSTKKDAVITLAIDSFIGLDHYKLFKDSYTILIRKEKTDKTITQIEKLVSNEVKMVFDGGNVDAEKIKKIIF